MWGDKRTSFSDFELGARWSVGLHELVFVSYHHLPPDPLTLDSHSQPLVVFALSVQTH